MNDKDAGLTDLSKLSTEEKKGSVEVKAWDTEKGQEKKAVPKVSKGRCNGRSTARLHQCTSTAGREMTRGSFRSEMEKELPADVALLIPRAVAAQEEAEEAERTAMAAIRGAVREAPDVGQEDRATPTNLEADHACMVWELDRSQEVSRGGVEELCTTRPNLRLWRRA